MQDIQRVGAASRRHQRTLQAANRGAAGAAIYTLPIIIMGLAFVVVLVWLTDLPPWLVIAAAALALFGYLLERRPKG